MLYSDKIFINIDKLFTINSLPKLSNTTNFINSINIKKFALKTKKGISNDKFIVKSKISA